MNSIFECFHPGVGDFLCYFWLPDVNEHTQTLQVLSGREVRRLLALLPLWAAMFACYLSCSQTSLQHEFMQSPLGRVLPELEVLMSKMDVDPSPLTLMEHILRKK
jgi:hypothetical protein